jgi:uncharacterized FlgJ-related protein
MTKNLKSAFISRGSLSLLGFLVLSAIIYLMYRYQKKTTIQDRIINSLIAGGVNPITATFVFAQACHETGNFTSPLYFSNNNCFGMKPPTTYIVAIGERFGYALYKNIEDSAKAMAIWLQNHSLSGGLQTIDQYVTDLHNQGYFEDSLENYLAGVKHFYSMYYE